MLEPGPSDDERRSQALPRLELLDALIVAIDRRDELMAIVGAAPDLTAARHQVRATFGLNEVQAVAVLDLQIRRFADEPRRRIVEERDQLRATVGLD